MKLKIFGSGCTKCNLLTQHAEAAARELGIEYELDKITNMNQIIDAGVLRTPAMAVDDKVVIEGKVPSTEGIKKYLSPTA
jgi:small redox-active disulfide protein 2